MKIKKHIPNLLTLGNLLCGTLAVIAAVNSDFETTALLVVLGVVFDFLDGFVARMLKVSGELGKQLDSLADMVTSGVVPGVVMYRLIVISSFEDMDRLNTENGILTPFSLNDYSFTWIAYVGLLLTLAACYRLANFNIDTRQSDSFIGLPTPAMSLFVLSLALIPMYSENQFFIDLIENSYFLIGVTLLFSYLMNAEIPLFSLKFKSFGLKENVLKYLFLTASLLLILTLEVIAIPLVIILYVILSLGSNLGVKKRQ